MYASSSYHNLIKKQLALYKNRWGSIADKIAVTDNIDEIPRTSSIVIPTFMSYNINPLNYSRVTTIDAVQNLSIYDLRRALVEPNVCVTKDIDEARSWLNQLGPVFAYDCETVPNVIDENLTQKDLSLDVFRNSISMYSFAETEDEAIVIINESQEMEDLVMDFLTSTESKVIMHNASFDMKIVKHRSEKFIKNYEDTQLLAWAYLNHADNEESKVGLKHLAGKVYGSWAVAKDLFGIEYKYSPELIHYSGIDACATMFVYNEYINKDNEPEYKSLDDIFPIMPPSEHEDTPRFFYENVMKPLIPHSIELMLNGIHLDLDKVSKLDEVLQDILLKVKNSLNNSELIKEFQKEQYIEVKQKKIEEYNSKKRDIRQYLKEYKDTDLVMRSYVVNTYLNGKDLDYSFYPLAQLPNGDIAWSVNDLKKFYKNNSTHRFIASIIDKTVSQSDPIVHQAMIELAKYKTELYNDKYDEKIEAIDKSILPEFNPASPPQKQKLFNYLGIEPIAFTDTGAPSWGREELEELLNTTSDERLKEVLVPLIEHSQSAIIKQNFINGFNKYHINGVLHGNFKLAGAKSFRPTSNKVNLLNMPSTGSIFAKPIKECFVAPEGFICAAIDYAALEDRVIANLSGDENKLAVFTEGIDGHSLASTYYFPEKVSEFIGPFTDNKEAAKELLKKTKVDKKAKALRQNSKPVTFKLAYGGYPDDDKGGAITRSIFDNYHNAMFPGISNMKEEAMIKATQDGKLHLGLGCFIRTNDVGKHSRTLFNALSQFWSVLTLITLARVNTAIKEAGYEEDIKVTASIYDSIYFIVREDATIIKWLNDTIIPIMTTDFLQNQIVHNDADLTIGTRWSTVEDTELPHSAELGYIQGVLDDISK